MLFLLFLINKINLYLLIKIFNQNFKKNFLIFLNLYLIIDFNYI